MNLFEKINSISTEKLSEDEVKKMVAEIIDVLKSHHITYDQGYEILNATYQTLEKMSTPNRRHHRRSS